MTTARTSPGPVIRAWDGPFASAGVASVMTAAMLMPAARAATTNSLRSMGRLLRLVPHFCYTGRGWQVPARAGATLARRAGDGERRCRAEIALQAQRDLAGAPDQGIAGGKRAEAAAVRARGRCTGRADGLGSRRHDRHARVLLRWRHTAHTTRRRCGRGRHLLSPLYVATRG